MLCQTVPQDSRTKKLKLVLSLIAKSKIRFQFGKKIYKRKVINSSLIVHYNVEYLNGSQNPEFLTVKEDNKICKTGVKIQKVEQFKQNPEGYTVHFDCLL